METIFDIGRPGKRAFSLPDLDVPGKKLSDLIPSELLRRKPPVLPEVSEGEIARHFTNLSNMNFGVDTVFYPLGSCTMKYNPKINEVIAGLNGFTNIHPYQDESQVQGALELMYELAKWLAEIGGVKKVSLQPAAGAHGELTGMAMIRSYHEHNGNVRSKVIIPDSAHGTNPATAAMLGYKVVQVPSDKYGGVDLSALERLLDEEVAAIFLTNPNTLGIFDKNIVKVNEMVHSVGALSYCDGANLNAILGKSRPGDMGFDVMHFNLHKTFSTPHGGGGPGAGPVGVGEVLEPFLPVPIIEKDESLHAYYLIYDRPLSIGRMRAFYGNFSVLVKAYCYIKSLGREGLDKVSDIAVLNANYVRSKLRDTYTLPYDVPCMHEFVLSADKQKKVGVKATDIAKRLLDFHIHPPTIYFPLIVEEALMIEPTETESLANLDSFVHALKQIAKEVEENPDILREAPHTTPVSRFNEAEAARHPRLRWLPGKADSQDKVA
ncbi:MAG: aminomethyl-transferring glycine dehydrogenase subunit GcvPB [Actinobacteria bacterium]|nr:aminomethyl-transferring glycine dehydrogenase subunit GcvPB [Actinomycetota bacterium]